ncbi:MAG TPA: hypothetical protein VHK70_04490 [Burkholderiaceae bacterium]|nr:hypothetical protein [Burkholderiaceae bacterium]
MIVGKQDWTLEELADANHQQKIRERNARFKQRLAESKRSSRKSTLLTTATLAACLSWTVVGMQIFFR